jgi:hypothetical protein
MRDNVFPPGLRGYVATEQLGQNNRAQNLGMLAQLMQMQGQMQDRQLQQQMMPLKLQGMLAELEAQKERAAHAQDKRAFFSPQNQQQYMEGGRPEIALPDDMQGPRQAAEPGQMNMGRFMQDAAARAFIPPETYFNHQQQVEQRRQAAQLQAQSAQERTQEMSERQRERNETMMAMQQERLQAQAEQARQRSEDQRLSQQERLQARADMIRLTASLRPAPQPHAPSPLESVVGPDGKPILVTRDQAVGKTPAGRGSMEKAMPSSSVKSLMDNQQNLRRAEQALTLISGNESGGVQGDPKATGWKGLLSTTEIGDQILQRADPKGVETRAAIADLGSMIIHDRSGAAVTAAEYPRLRPFIPKVTDDAATAKKKLNRFVAEYRAVQKEAVDFYSESGYKVPENALQPPPTAPAAPAGASGGWSIKEKGK